MQIQTETPQRLLFPIREAASRLSLSTISIRRLVRRRLLKPVPGVRKLLFSENELQRFAGQTAD